jgi:transcriptional antiterminator NusG
MDSNQHDQNDQQDQAQWYVAHTYSGYENKVKASIEATVENRNMEELILEVQVPVQEIVESKNGKRVVKEKKLFPGYVMIKMFMTDDSWYVVRNTRGVTGFVGPASKPVPLSKGELKSMGIRQQRVEISMKVGEEVKVTEGPLEGFTGIIEEVHPEKSKVKVNVSMFGRETLAELGFEQIEKINT